MESYIALDQSTVQDACERASRIRTAVDQLCHLVDQAYRDRDWGPLGETTRQEYVEKELGMTNKGPIILKWVLGEAATPSQPGLTSDE